MYVQMTFQDNNEVFFLIEGSEYQENLIFKTAMTEHELRMNKMPLLQ